MAPEFDSLLIRCHNLTCLQGNNISERLTINLLAYFTVTDKTKYRRTVNFNPRFCARTSCLQVCPSCLLQGSKFGGGFQNKPINNWLDQEPVKISSEKIFWPSELPSENIKYKNTISYCHGLSGTKAIQSFSFCRSKCWTSR